MRNGPLVQHRKSEIHGLPVTLRMLRVKSDKSDWFWSQSIVFTQSHSKPFKTGISLDLARGRDSCNLVPRALGEKALGNENANGLKKILRREFRATLNFRKLRPGLNVAFYMRRIKLPS